MKKNLACMLAIGVLVLPALAMSAEFRLGEQPSVRAEERVADMYMAGGGVTSAGTVAGDLVAAAGNVVISGNVEADILAAGGNVTVFSVVGDDLRVGGGNVVVQGGVGGDLIAVAGQFTLGGLGVGGDAAIAGGSVRIDAPIRGNVKIGGGNVYINAPIGGSLQVDAETLTLGSAAIISGNLNYKASEELMQREGAAVLGKVSFEPRARPEIPAVWMAGLVSLWFLGKFLALFVCALLVALVFRRYSRTLVAKAMEKPLLELGRGLLVLVAMPALSVLALLTVVGIPLGLLGILGFVLALGFAWIITPILIGSAAHKYLFKGEGEVSWKSVLIGTALYTLLGVVPLAGSLAQILLMVLALGAGAAIKWEVAKEWK